MEANLQPKFELLKDGAADGASMFASSLCPIAQVVSPGQKNGACVVTSTLSAPWSLVHRPWSHGPWPLVTVHGPWSMVPVSSVILKGGVSKDGVSASDGIAVLMVFDGL